MRIGAAVSYVLMAAMALAQIPAPNHNVTPEEYERWKKELSNWGRWGKDDQLGTLKLITPAKRKQAAALVKEGVSVSLAGDLDTVKAVDNPDPFELKMLSIGMDQISVNYHGIAHTHLDSLAHINDKGVFFNGYKPDADTVMKQGHAKNSIHNLKNGIFTRGVLIDIPRLKGVPYLEPGTPIYVEDIEAWEKKAGVKITPGDALFIRTGVWARRKALGPWQRGRAEGGRRRGARSVGNSLAQETGIALMAAIIRSTWRPRPYAARSTISRCCTWAFTCSTTAIWKPWPTPRRHASVGISC